MTTMKTIAGKNTLQVLLIAHKDGEKACEMDITEMSPQEAGEQIGFQEMQGRTWEYRVISRYVFPEL